MTDIIELELLVKSITNQHFKSNCELWKEYDAKHYIDKKLPEELGTMEKEVGAPIDTNYANTRDGRKLCGNPP